MAAFVVNKNKLKDLSRDELLQFNKEDLVDRIIQLQAHTQQLKNIISKRGGESCTKTSSKAKKARPFDFTKCTFRRIFLHIAYLGAKYQGLAAQEDSNNTIESFLFDALKKCQLIKSRDTSNYHRCGRTDKGVSATGQVISLLIRSRLTGDQIDSFDTAFDELPYCRMLNRLLPDDIRAIAWTPIKETPGVEPMSARFDCKHRTYKYWFPKCSMNIEAMKSACESLIGSHDFRNLCKMDVANGVTTYIRHIYSADIVSVGNSTTHNEFNMYYLKIVGNAFLWHQIRCIAAVIFMVGDGKEEPDIINKLLNVNDYPQKPQYNMAIETPLNLFSCAYEFNQPENMEIVNGSNQGFIKNSWVIDTDNLITVIKSLFAQWTVLEVQASTIKDFIEHLLTYSNDSDSWQSSIFHNANLLQGVKSREYVPLLKRRTCETLENRILHYAKKKRIKETATDSKPRTSD